MKKKNPQSTQSVPLNVNGGITICRVVALCQCFFICSFIIQEKKKEKMEKRSAFRKCFFFIWLLNMQEV